MFGLILQLWTWVVVLLSIILKVKSDRDFKTDHIYVVIPVKARRETLQECIRSLIRHSAYYDTTRSTELIQHIVLIDDGSPSDTIAYEKSLCSRWRLSFTCAFTKDPEIGQTFAVQKGVDIVMANINSTTNGAVVVLSPDTVVTSGWLSNLYDTLNSKSDVMAVGPVSNAAAYQSIPLIRDSDDDWATNPFPMGLHMDYLASILQLQLRQASEAAMNRAPPVMELAVLHEFCIMYRFDVFRQVGSFDTTRFASGEGAVVDLALRVKRAGYRALVTPRAYVYHTLKSLDKLLLTGNADKLAAKQKAKKRAKKLLIKKYKYEMAVFGKEASKSAVKMIATQTIAGELYSTYQKKYDFVLERFKREGLSVALVVSGKWMDDGPGVGNGAWNSPLVHEIVKLKEYGIKVAIFVPSRTQLSALVETNSSEVLTNLHTFNISKSNPRLHLSVIPNVQHTSIKPAVLNSILVGPTASQDMASVAQKIFQYDAVISESCKIIAGLRELLTRFRNAGKSNTPHFYLHTTSSASPPDLHDNNLFGIDVAPLNRHNECVGRVISSSQNEGPVGVFVRSEWERRSLLGRLPAERNFRIPPWVLSQGLDRHQYYTNEKLVHDKMRIVPSVYRMVVLMSPSIARNSSIALRVVLKLFDAFGANVQITFWGVSKSSILKKVKNLSGSDVTVNISAIASANVTYVDELIKLGDILRRSDFALDIGAWQSSSELAIQAMACGCVAVLPLQGIGSELCSIPTSSPSRQSGTGSVFHSAAFPPCVALDTSDPDAYVGGLMELTNTPFRRIGVMESGMLFSKQFSFEQSAAELLYTLNKDWDQRNKNTPN